jgi:tetratricopeptide (TPR) repeat protein
MCQLNDCNIKRNDQMYKIKFIFICFLSVLCCLGCYKEKKNKIIHDYSDFQSHYLRGISTTDMEVVADEIKYMDSIIKSEGNKNVKSIYYNKAQLYYRLKKYDDAIAVLYETNDERYDIAKTALLILLGCDAEAQALLDNQIEKNKTILYHLSIDQNQTDVLILGTISLYILSDMSIDSFLDDLIDRNIVTREYLDNMLMHNELDKDVILNSMWPN